MSRRGPKPRPNPLTPADVYEFRAGKTSREIGGEYGVDNVTVLKWLHQLGVDTSDRQRNRRAVTLAAVAPVAAKYSAGEIGIEGAAALLGVHYSTARRWLIRAGCVMRPAQRPRQESP